VLHSNAVQLDDATQQQERDTRRCDYRWRCFIAQPTCVVDRAAIVITALPNPPPGRQARMRMEPCLCSKRLRTTRRSRAGAARGGGTPCATSRGRWSAAWSRKRTFFCKKGEATSGTSSLCDQSTPLSPTTFWHHSRPLMPLQSREGGPGAGPPATLQAHQESSGRANSHEQPTAKCCDSPAALYRPRPTHKGWRRHPAAPVATLQPTAGHARGTPTAATPSQTRPVFDSKDSEQRRSGTRPRATSRTNRTRALPSLGIAQKRLKTPAGRGAGAGSKGVAFTCRSCDEKPVEMTLRFLSSPRGAHSILFRLWFVPRIAGF